MSSSSSSKTSSSQTYKIETVQLTKRDGHQYPVEPRDAGTPELVRKGSFYETGVDDQPQYKYLQASDVRRQVQEAPDRIRSAGAYPRKYHNDPPQQLSARRPWREHPITPSPGPGEAPSNYKKGDKPGPIRAFYNEKDRSKFDVGYHDTKRPSTGPQNGAEHEKSPFSLATYHPGPTYIDTSEVKKNKAKK